jgi:hypothetical protein
MPVNNRSRARTRPAQQMRKNYDGSSTMLPFEQRQMSSSGTNTIDKIERMNLNNAPDFRNRAFQDVLCSIVGSTSTGRAWAMAALHPCGAGEVTAANVGDLQGMSDTMTGSVATPVYRSENHLRFAAELFQNNAGLPIDPTTLGTTTYGIDIIIPPFPEIIFIYRLIDDGTGIKSPWVVVRQPDYQQPAVVPIASSPPSFGYTTATNGTTMASVGYGKTRIIGRGLTIELDAAALNDQGRVVVGQMQGQMTDLELSLPSVTTNTAAFVTAVDPTVTTAPAVISLNNHASPATTKVHLLSVPTDPAVIASNCPSAYQGLAKHGAYVVQKFASPLYGYEFKTTGSQQVYEAAENELGETVPYFPYTALAIGSNGFNDSSNLDNSDNFWVSNSAGSNPLQSGFGNGETPLYSADGSEGLIVQSTLHPFVSEPSDMMTSVVTFRNLPAGVTSGTTASLRVKGRTYLECISNGSNPVVAPYVHSPADFDMQALHSVIVAGKRMGDAYPASANSLGGILGSIWGAIRDIGRPIAKQVGALRIPFISDIANAADDIVGGIDSAVARFGK